MSVISHVTKDVVRSGVVSEGCPRNRYIVLEEIGVGVVNVNVVICSGNGTTTGNEVPFTPRNVLCTMGVDVENKNR